MKLIAEQIQDVEYIVEEKGDKKEAHLKGMFSRIFQHEYDHMLGRQFTERVSKLKLDFAMKKAKKQWKLAERRQSLTNK